MGRPRVRITTGLLFMVFVGLAGCESQAPETPLEVPPLVEATIEDLQRAIRDGRTSCAAIVEGYLARIEAYDQATKLNAITVVNPRAIEKAQAIDSSPPTKSSALFIALPCLSKTTSTLTTYPPPEARSL